MKFFSYISDLMIPLLLFYIVGYGFLAKRDIYKDFLDGAKIGLKTVAGIVPTLIGLMTGVGILRASGFLDFFASLLGKVTASVGIPADIVPLAVIRMFSSSAANSLLLDIFKKFGTDSRSGLMAAIMLSSTESVFYCMSVYFGSVNIQKTRYTLPLALISALAALAAAVMIVNFWMV